MAIGGRTVNVTVVATCKNCGFKTRLDIPVPVGTKKVSPPDNYYCGAAKCLAAREATPEAVRARIAQYIDVSRKNPGLLNRMLSNGTLPDGVCREIVSSAEEGGDMEGQIPDMLLQIAREHLARGNAAALQALRARRASVIPTTSVKGTIPGRRPSATGDTVDARS